MASGSSRMAAEEKVPIRRPLGGHADRRVELATCCDARVVDRLAVAGEQPTGLGQPCPARSAVHERQSPRRLGPRDLGRDRCWGQRELGGGAGQRAVRLDEREQTELGGIVDHVHEI